MTSIRSSGATALLVALLVAGCGGSGATTASTRPADAGSGNDAGAAESTDPGTGTVATPAPTATPDPGAAEDAARVGTLLVPPNSTELSRTTTPTYWYVIYQSTDSPEALKAFYEGEIPKAGMQIVSTTSAQGTFAWAIARDASGTFGGAVTVGPASDGGSGSSVIVAVGS